MSFASQCVTGWNKKPNMTGGYDKVIEQHQTILNAIEARDSDTAQSAMRTHLEMGGEKLVEAILIANSEN